MKPPFRANVVEVRSLAKSAVIAFPFARSQQVVRVVSLLLLSAGALPWAEPQVVAQTSISGAEQREGGEAFHLVWSDEFNEEGDLDPKKWTFERGFVRNQELQWYQPENASCEGGLLIIEARRERVSNSDFAANRADWRREPSSRRLHFSLRDHAQDYTVGSLPGLKCVPASTLVRDSGLPSGPLGFGTLAGVRGDRHDGILRGAVAQPMPVGPAVSAGSRYGTR